MSNSNDAKDSFSVAKRASAALLQSKSTRNIVTLFAWQISVYLVPLVTTPYLARVLGVEQFGVMGVAGSVLGYVSLISDWGFSLSATQQVARNAHRPEVLRRLFWDTLFAKVLLGVVALTCLVAATLLLPALRAMTMVLLAASLQVISGIFSVSWFLLGLEKMGAFAVASLVGRFLSLPMILLLVHGPHDTVIAVAVQGACGLVSVGASLSVAFRAVPLVPARLSLRSSWAQIRSGALLFLSMGAISLYTQTNIVAVGFVAGPVQAGLFSGADRIRKAVQGLSGPISTALYPRINNLVANGPQHALRTMIWLLIGQGLATLMLSVALWLGSGLITRLFLGAGFEAAKPALQWLSAVPALVGINNVFGINMMLPMGMRRAFTAATLGSGLVNIALLFPFCRAYGATGGAMAMVVSEAFVVIAMGLWLYLDRAKLAALSGPRTIETALEEAAS